MEEQEPYVTAMRGRGAIKQSTQRLKPHTDGVTNTITSVQKDNLIVEPKPQIVGNYKPSGYDSGNVFRTEGISPTVRENHGSVVSIVEPVKVVGIRSDEGIREFNDNIYGALRSNDSCGDKAVIEQNTTIHTPTATDEETDQYVMFNNHPTHDGDGLYYCWNGSKTFNSKPLPNLSRSLKASMHDASVCVYPRIRKLTERECFRLMGVDDADIDKIQDAGISRTQQYKMAGNSIVVDVLCHIFDKLLIHTECDNNRQMTLF